MSDIAVIGLSCHLPGAEDYNEYWLNLVRGVNSVTEIPGDRWDWRRYYGEPAEGKNKTSCKWGGFIRNADKFDSAFFGISPREAQQIDPQQRLVLQLAWQCIEDAGYLPKDLSGSDTGVFVGVSTFDYKELQEKYAASIEGHSATGIHNTIVPNRISYFFNFHGPSIAIDSACAGSLVCIHEAVNSIRAGECSAALVGGVSLLATPTTFIRFQKAGMLSPTGACRTFDESADGYVRGEGAGMVFLKSLQQALADNDRILAVIKGSAVNHGGRARSITAPNALSQSKVIVAALKNAGVSPATISYIEAHGTGTPLGDPIEIHGLNRAFRQLSRQDSELSRKQYCALGAVKTNIGHLEAGAGIAGLIKVILALQHRKLPPNANFSKLNPRIELEDTPFYVLDSCRDWTPLLDRDGAQIPLRAGISSFGFGGVNSHVILEQAPLQAAASQAPMVSSPTPVLLALSANSDASLLRLAARYVDLLKSRPESFADICYDANTRRTRFPRRLAFVAGSAVQMAELLETWLKEAKPASTLKQPKIGFLFTGQGSQYPGMAGKLYATQPVFREALLECEQLLKPYLDRSLTDLLFNAGQDELNRTCYTQPVLFSVEYALTMLLQSRGIRPDAVIGHSVGELVAACIAGVYPLQDGLRMIARRGQLIDGLKSNGGMAAVFAGAADTEAFLKKHKLPLEIAAVNAPTTTVISGEMQAVQTAARLFAEAGIEHRMLEVSQAFHSALVELAQPGFSRELRDVRWSKPGISLISNVSGDIADEAVSGPDYWVDHIRKPVLFQKGIESMSRLGVNVWLEVGPAPVLTGLGKRCIRDAGHWLCCLRPDIADDQNFLELLAALFTLGLDPDFNGLWQRSSQPRLAPPVYPFDGQRYWFAQESQVSEVPWINRLLAAQDDPLLGRRMFVAGGNADYFVSNPGSGELDYLQDHCVHGTAVMPAAAYLSMALSAARQADALKAGSCEISEAVFYRPLLLEPDILLQTALRKEPGKPGYLFEIWSQRQDAAPVSDWVLHAAGRVKTGHSVPIAVDSMPESAGSRIDPAELYRDLHAKGLQYGPGFQGLVAIDRHADCCIAEVRLQPGLAETGNSWMHPAVCDAVFQAVSALLPPAAFDNGLLPLPVGVERIEISGPLSGPIKVRASLVRFCEGVYHCDYRLASADGKPLASITGLKLKPIAPALSQPAAASAAEPVRSDDLFYQPVWQRHPVQAREPAAGGKTLIFYPAEARALAQALGERLVNALPVCIGKARGLPKGALKIDPDDEQAFSELLSRHDDLQSVYFMGGFQTADLKDEAAFQEAQQKGMYCLFRLIKGLYARGLAERGLELKIVTNRSFPVYANDEVLPWGAGVHGLASVFCNENPAIRLASIDLGYGGEGDIETSAESLICEAAQPGGTTVAYRGGHRYLRRLEPVTIDKTANTAFRRNGVYLILGGAGGIGLALSRYLAERYQAKLVWIGRSALDEYRSRSISELRQLGGDVMYLQADGCDVAALRDAVRAAVEHFGVLNGAIHSALVLKDQALANMNMHTFAEGVTSKVDASWALYQAVSEQPLDFLMFFSSVNSFYANKGQANYVAGCVFKDSFAHYLGHSRGVPVKIINWGYWGDVGAVASEDYRRRLEAQGIHALDSATGMDALERALMIPAAQLAVVKAQAETLFNAGFDLSWRNRFADRSTRLDIEHWSDSPAPLFEPPATPDVFARSYTGLERFAEELLATAFAGLLASGTETGADFAVTALPGADRYRRFYAAAFDILRRSDVGAPESLIAALKTEHSSVTDGASVKWRSLESSREQLLREYPWLAAELALLWQCASNLAPVLRGETTAAKVIFPDLSMSLLEAVYRDTPSAEYFNRQLAERVACAAQADSKDGVVKILEIGAGTGCLSRVVLERLAIDAGVTGIDYVYTDTVRAFVDASRETLGKQYSFTQFGVLDIARDIGPQGYEAGSFDIVVASNVFCVVSDINTALRNAKALLKKGGVLLFNELTANRNFITLTFGLLDDWWSFGDAYARMEHAPLLTPQMWRYALLESGFSNISLLPVHENIAGVAGQRVMAAVSDGWIRQRDTGHAQASAGTEQSAERVSVDEVLSLLGKADKREIAEKLLAYFSGELAEVLRIDAARMAAGRSLPDMLLSELGMDSLTAMDLRGRLKKKLNADVPAEVLLGGSSIQAVIDRIYEQLLLIKLMGGQSYESAQAAAGAENEEQMETLVI